jgi:hypothetical protein
MQKAPAGHALQDACAAVSWYCPAGHLIQAAAAAPPLLYEPDAQLPDTAVKPVPKQYMPGVQKVAAVRPVDGQNLPFAGHGVAFCIAGEGQ